MVIRRDFRRSVRPAGFLSRWSMTHLIIFVNVVAFFLFLILSSFIPSIFDFVAIKPSFILSSQYIWTVVTSVFMHGGFFLFFVCLYRDLFFKRRLYFWRCL